MEQKENGLRKLNTFLLTLCTSGILWMASSINNLDSKMSRLEALFDSHSDLIKAVTQRTDKNTLDITDLIIKLSTLTIINDQKQKHG